MASPPLTEQPLVEDTLPTLASSALPTETSDKPHSYTDLVSHVNHLSSPTQLSQPNPQPDLKPFFTLVTDTTFPRNRHPNVHYIFSDDPPDTSPITSAALQVLDPSSASAITYPTTDHSTQPSRKQKDRYILLDLDSSGTKVVSARSMSPDWAVVFTELGPAPTWEGEQVNEEGKEEKGLMLRVEGMGVCDANLDESKKELGGEGKGLDELVEEYERKLIELRKVVAAGGPGMANSPGLA